METAAPSQWHVLSFEGPDAYARAGGLASRVDGLTRTLASLGWETHLWFVGDPDLPGHEVQGRLHLHRWVQWVSRHHPGGVYDGEDGKRREYSFSLPPALLSQHLLPHLRQGGRAAVLAEEWHTADAVLHLHHLLSQRGLRKRVSMLWNANNIFGWEHIHWERLREAATVTTVSRYMKHRMWACGVDPVVVPNGLAADAFDPPDRAAVAELRCRFRDRTLLAKMARWDPDKRWLESLEIVSELKRRRWRPLLIMRGGSESHGYDVLAKARAQGLRIVERHAAEPGTAGLLGALRDLDQADAVNLRSYVNPQGRRMLFRGTHAVLANSAHEPFGLVGLETMAAGGLACTGCSGEEYAFPGQNAIVLETGEPREFLGLFQRLQSNPTEARALRRAGHATARRYTWTQVLERVLLPRVELS